MLLEMQQPQCNFYTEILNKEVFDISPPPPHHLGTDKQDVVARLNAENGQLRAVQNDKCNPTERCSPQRKVGEISNNSYWNTERQQMSTILGHIHITPKGCARPWSSQHSFCADANGRGGLSSACTELAQHWRLFTSFYTHVAMGLKNEGVWTKTFVYVVYFAF